MGLVSTWLSGIGLQSVVPTFEAAGIVSPSHLADLDVSYFESLGVTDPDDRRKLFYLVQRIKLAVNNKKDSSSKSEVISAEERVDAVISENFVNKEKESGSHNKYSLEGDDHYSRKESFKDAFCEEKKVEAEPLRRSKRIRSSKKKTTKKVNSKEKSDSVKDVSDPAATRGTLSASATNQKKSAHRKSKNEVVKSPPASPSKQSPTKKSSSKLAKERKEKAASNKSAIPSMSSASIKDLNTGSRSDVNREANDNDRINPTIVQMSNRKNSSQGNQNHFSNRQQPESRLPVSTRTVKRLPTTLKQNISSQKSLIESTSSLQLGQNDEVRTDKSNIQNSKTKRRVTMTSNLDALGKPFQTSSARNELSGNDTEINFKPKESDSFSRINASRSSKSMSISQSALLQQYQRGHQKRSSMSSARNKQRPSQAEIVKGDQTMSIAHQSIGKASPSRPVITQGMSEANESWATKIDYLREDNDAEHELFRDQAGDESQYHEYYDMRIKVIVRKRPLSRSESLTGGIDIIHPLDYGSYGKTLVYQPKTRVDLTKEVETIPFAFDNVFDESSSNIAIYNRSLRNLVEPFFQGQWATVFAYGQTGSGKTYTMMGSNITGVNAGTATIDESNLGLYYLAALDIFETIKSPEYNYLSVHVSLFEIYGGKLFDLLNDRNQIKCLEDSKGKVCFPGLTEHSVHAPEHVMNLIEEGSKNRSTGTTSRNADSSRSHAVLQIKLVKNAGRKKNVEHGRFSFIDLAGSERGADTSNASKATRLEGAEINTSLLALKEVIRALATGGSMTHIPFRGSKLTQVLKDSFVGENSRCCMVACVSPDIGNCEQTLNTLRYADRVKERNPETGVLSTSCQQSTKVSSCHPFTQIGKTISSPSSPQKASHNHRYRAEESTDIRRNYLDDISIGENDYSQSFPSNSTNEKVNQSKSTEKQKAGQDLVSNHRSVMSRWLSIVKDEMNLVNQADADREGLDDYILQLQNVQRIQIDFLSELRRSLQKYVSAAEGPHQTIAAEDDDDSFEDLRD